MYADYQYYITQYLFGRESAIPEEGFSFWEKQAAKEIDKYTMGRVRALKSNIPNEVKECTCEIAELLYTANLLSEEAVKQGAAGLLTSYSNDGESGSYDMSVSVYTEEGKQKKIRRIISTGLSYTGLLYRGGMQIES